MANNRDLNHKISSLQNMQKVMKAMNMIASIKLRRLISAQESLALFRKAVEGQAEDIRTALGHTRHPLLSGYGEVKKRHFILFTADKGLCGAHNSSVLKAFEFRLAETQGTAFDVTCIGTKGAGYCRRKGYEIYTRTEISDKVFGKKQLKELASRLFARYLSGEIQDLQIIGNDFVSTIQQEVRMERILPLEQGQGKRGNALTEPEPEEFLPAALERYLMYRMQTALAESLLSEQAARMTAMENATDNAEDLIDRYTTLLNRARQTSITNDIIEIVSGKEALEG